VSPTRSTISGGDSDSGRETQFTGRPAGEQSALASPVSARVGCGTLLLAFCAAGLTLVEASPALADTGWYPFAATPCIWSPYATSGPLPQGQLDYWCPGYDWGTVEVPAGTSTSAILTTAEVAGQFIALQLWAIETAPIMLRGNLPASA